jgi:regulator of sirC expression with transglutaminase-like and TPR domain
VKAFKLYFSILIIFLVVGNYSSAQTADDYFQLAMEKYEKLDYKGAVLLLTQSIKLNPTDVQALTNRGIARHKLKDYKGAAEDFS